MPAPLNVKKAEIKAVVLKPDGAPPTDLGHKLTVQFNPETLQVQYQNRQSGGDQRQGGSTQHADQGTTRMTVELWFESTAPLPQGESAPNRDVRELVAKLAFFLKPHKDANNAPPAMRFHWGSFLFDGMVESMTEKLEYFTPDGIPIRAQVSLTLAAARILFQINRDGGAGGAQAGAPAGAPGSPSAPGKTPTAVPKAGQTLDQVAAQNGGGNAWAYADANKLESIRDVPVGKPLKKPTVKK
jgi:hypothetical protein